ncbi:MAG: hypothetical protein JRF72_11385 [Deltaproteobacteria bacterium]|jgi:inosine/xanthosine triphosphate pyrophosphatase family protein|nr:hypothetical protein [Deltaproteobacteria bacterium]
MSFWTAAVIIAAITTFGTIYRARIKANAHQSDENTEALLQRIERLEERIANLETIVLEKEKARQFSDL